MTTSTRQHRHNRPGTIRKVTAWKPRLEALEDRLALSGFADHFEGATLDPFWTARYQNAGSITFPSTTQAHTGNQAVQFNSTLNSGQKGIGLGHVFPQAVYGRVSVWVFDTGADQPSSNYLELNLDNGQGRGAHILTADYDLGPTFGGHYYVNDVTYVQQDIDSGIDRTQAWHQLTIDSRPDSISFAIDGTTVYTSPHGLAIKQIVINMFGPTWRPAWVSYFDDFEFIPYGEVDIAPTSLAWNTAQAGVDFGYRVDGADLTQDTTAALYWASGESFDQRLGAPVYTTTIERPQGEYGPFYVPNARVLGSPPPFATHLLLVTDPPDATDLDGVITESDENNNVRALAIPDIEVRKVTTNDSRSITITYAVTGANLDHVPIRVYRSADDRIDPTSDEVLDLAGAAPPLPGTIGEHTITLPLAAPLGILPARPHILVVANPDGEVPETHSTNNTAFFQKRELAVITHGLNLFGGRASVRPRWVWIMAGDLPSQEGYDGSLPFDWTSTSNDLRPGVTEEEGLRMARAVALKLDSMRARWPNQNDVFDVHFIGHSRGAVVVSQALQNLVGNAELERGYTKMTLLDPHPARNHFLTPRYSVRPGIAGFLAERLVVIAQAAMQDPEVFVPRNVDETEVFYQNTLWSAYRPPYSTYFEPDDRFINLWGELPVLNLSGHPVIPYNLTSLGVSHGGVVDWYIDHVLPGLDGRVSPGTQNDTPETNTLRKLKANDAVFSEAGALAMALTDEAGTLWGRKVTKRK